MNQLIRNKPINFQSVLRFIELFSLSNLTFPFVTNLYYERLFV